MANLTNGDYTLTVKELRDLLADMGDNNKVGVMECKDQRTNSAVAILLSVGGDIIHGFPSDHPEAFDVLHTIFNAGKDGP